MSIEAIAYVKTLDLGEHETAAARLLLYVVGENTFNDSFVCRLSQKQLGFEAGRITDRTVRRLLDKLEQGRIILRPGTRKRIAENGQLAGDVIRIVGFKRWYFRNHAEGKRRAVKQSRPADKMSAGGAGANGSDQRTNCPEASGHRSPLASGQQVSAAYKDTRTSKSVPLARDARSEGLNSDLEGKGVRDRLRQNVGGPKFAAWLADMAFELSGDLVIATSPERFKAEWAERHFAEKILAACRAEWPAARTVTIRHGLPHAAQSGAAAPGGSGGARESATASCEKHASGMTPTASPDGGTP